MRLSLWQQFSSNNSSSFVLVGRFQSNEAAHHAYDIIHDALNQIADDYRQQPGSFKENLYEPSAVETAVFQPHGVEIEYAIDWLFRAYPTDEIVSLFDQYVIISDPSIPNEAGEKPFDALMLKLGGEIYVRGGLSRENFQIQLMCISPDTLVADKIYDALLNSEREPIPWIEYYGSKKVEQSDKFWQQYRTLLAYAPLTDLQYHLSTRIKSLTVNAESHQAELSETREKLSQVELQLSELETVLPPLTWDEKRHIIYVRDAVKLHTPIIQRQGLNLVVQFSGVGNTYRGMTVGFPALVFWLKELGCEVNIEFMRSKF